MLIRKAVRYRLEPLAEQEHPLSHAIAQGEKLALGEPRGRRYAGARQHRLPLDPGGGDDHREGSP